MKDWQFDVLFAVGITGALVMLFSDPLHISVKPEVVTLFGVMLAFLYQQKKNSEKKEKKVKLKSREDLDELNLSELRSYARAQGLTVHDYLKLTREELTDLILEVTKRERGE